MRPGWILGPALLMVLVTANAAPALAQGVESAGAGEARAGDARQAIRRIVAQAVSGERQVRVPGSLPADVISSIEAWIAANRPALNDLKPTALVEQPWGLTAMRSGGNDRPSLLYLYVFDWHVSGTLPIYGMTGRVKRAYLLNDPARTPLAAALRVRSTFLTVPKAPPDPLATVVVLELQGHPETAPLVVYPAAGSGIIRLHGRDAVVHGRTLRYEPEPLKQTLGYWIDSSDWAAWQFEVPKPGSYTVQILQGCGKGSGGSKVELAVGGQVLRYTVEDTGGFQNFVTRNVGAYRFDKPGRYTLTVTPTHKPGAAVMDLREVTLTPAKQ